MTLRYLTLPRFAALSVALTLLPATILCAQSPVSAARTQTPAMRGYPAVGAPPVITMLAPGAAPRTQLRYVIPANQKASMDVRRSGSSMMTSKGVSVPTDMPTTKMTVDLEVTSVAPNGDISYDLTFTGFTLGADAAANPTANPTLRRIMAGITSSKGSATVSNRGVTTSTRLDVTDLELKEVISQWTSSVERLWTLFPEKAVGLGARWEVRQAIAAGGSSGDFRPTIFQKTEYEVVSIDGPAVSLKVKTEQTGPTQVVRNVPSGVEMNMEKMYGSGLGTVTVQLNSLVPTSEIISTTSTQGTMVIQFDQLMSFTLSGRAKDTIAPPGTARGPDKWVDLKALRGIKVVNLGGTHTSTVGPDRVCYPRSPNAPGGNFAGVSIAMGGLLGAATEVLQAGGINNSPRTTDFLTIDAQIHDAAQCKATVALELRRGLGKPFIVTARNGEQGVGHEPAPVVWRRVFEITGVPAGFSARVMARLKLDVADFVSDVAQARKSPSPSSPDHDARRPRARYP